MLHWTGPGMFKIGLVFVLQVFGRRNMFVLHALLLLRSGLF